jgi:hypothetical protein
MFQIKRTVGFEINEREEIYKGLEKGELSENEIEAILNSYNDYLDALYIVNGCITIFYDISSKKVVNKFISIDSYELIDNITGVKININSLSGNIKEYINKCNSDFISICLKY